MKKIFGGVAICYLDNNDSALFHDGITVANLDGSMGQWMVDLPEYWYKVDNPSEKVYSVEMPTEETSGYNHSRRVLLGVTKGIVANEKMWSKSGITPTAYITPVQAHDYCIANGTGFDMIDWETHIKIAYMFMAKYGNRDPQAMDQFGTGDSLIGRQSGTTADLGNNDGKSSTQVNIFGIEDPYGNLTEWMGGIHRNYKTYYIYDGFYENEEPSVSHRTVYDQSFSFSSYYISSMFWGNYGDLIPVKVDGGIAKYYADYGNCGYNTGWYYATRSYERNDKKGGLFYFGCNGYSSSYNSSTGSRIQYRGKITVIEDPAEFIAMPVGF